MLPPKPTHFGPLPFVSEIDFDTVPSGTLINNHYPGVTFEATPGTMYPNSGAVLATAGIIAAEKRAERRKVVSSTLSPAMSNGV
jgi:hypothetical protein